MFFVVVVFWGFDMCYMIGFFIVCWLYKIFVNINKLKLNWIKLFSFLWKLVRFIFCDLVDCMCLLYVFFINVYFI